MDSLRQEEEGREVIGEQSIDRILAYSPIGAVKIAQYWDENAKREGACARQDELRFES
jgi:hypothetical protein